MNTKINNHSKKTYVCDTKSFLDWDFAKNKDLDPNILTKNSNIRVWWKCHVCGHEWEAVICNRTREYKNGCPACSNRVLVVGKNDLATTHPHIAKEWHPTKNGFLKPSDVMHGSSRVVWWICPKGHEYQASLNKRTSGEGTNCPICNSQRQTSFAEQAFYFYIKKMFPDAISRYKNKELGRFELDIYIPSQKTAIEYDGEAWHKSNKKEREIRKYQLCKKLGIRLYRIREGEKPKYEKEICDFMLSGENLYKHKNLDSAIVFVLQRIEPPDFLNLNPVSSPSRDFYKYDVDVERDRYEILKYVTSEVKNSILKVRPEIADEWHPTKNHHMKPEFVFASSSTKYWWKCNKCGHEFLMSPNVRKMGSGCPICGREKRKKTYVLNKISKEGSISNPILLKEWNYEKNSDLKPSDFTRASQTSVWWKCNKCGYEWKAKISNREHGRGCPLCANRVLVKGKNDLATQYPEIAKEWDYTKNYPLTPLDIVSGHNTKVWWICPTCGHSYQAPPSRRTSQGTGCRKCADKANPQIRRNIIIAKEGSFGERYPYLLEEFSKENDVDPFKITKGYSDKIKWVCKKCGHEWFATLNSRTKGAGCPECAKKIHLVKVINLDTGIEYNSIREASDLTGIDAKAISSNCCGRTKQAGGYHWQRIK